MTMIAVLSPGLQGIHNPEIHDTLTIGGPDGIRFLDFRRRLLGGHPEMRGVAAHATTHQPEMQRLLSAIRPHLYTSHLLRGYNTALGRLMIEVELWTLEHRSQVKLITDLMLLASFLEDVPDYRQHSNLLSELGLDATKYQGTPDPLINRTFDARDANDAAIATAPGNAPLERLLAEFSQQHPSFSY